MDKKDAAIIEELAYNPKGSLEEIAKKADVSKGTVRNRISRLEKQGILVSYKARIRYPMLDMAEAIVGLDIAPEAYVSAIEELKRNGLVRELYTTTGDHAAIAVVVSKREDISKDLKLLSGIKGIRNLYPAIVTDIVK